MKFRAPSRPHSPRFQDKSFTPLLRRVLVLFSLIGVFAMTLYCQQSLKHERESLLGQLALQADFVATSSQVFFDNIGNSLELATRQMRDKTDLEPDRGLLTQVLAQHPEIAFISIFDARGNRLLTEFTAQSLGEIRQEDFAARLPERYSGNFGQLLADIGGSAHYSVGRVEHGGLTGQWRIPFRSVRRLPDGSIDTIVHASIPVARQTALWAHMGFPPGTRMGLYRDDGFVLARWPEPGVDPALIYGEAKPPRSPMEAVVRDKRIRGFYEGFNSTNGDVRLGAYARLPHLPLTAFVSVPPARVYQRWWRHNYALVIAFAVCFTTFFGFAVILMRREKAFSTVLMAQASTDTLTGLPNRLAAERHLQRRVEQTRVGRPAFAVMFIDLDRFKSINDHFGHDYGDQVLQQAARRLKAQIREDDLLARLGGDEFMAVLDCRNEGQARAAASRLMTAVEAPFLVKGQSFRLSMSVGVSLYPRDGAAAVELLKRADIAMYSVKHASRNGYALFMEEMLNQITDGLVVQQPKYILPEAGPGDAA